MISTCLIIDDEQHAREIIKKYLVGASIDIIGECENGFEGIKYIQERKPDLIFLDIQMPKLDGFEMLELLEDPPHVIFTTAYDEYAIRAFEQNAVDYILKPFSKSRFDEALEKALSRIEEGGGTKSFEMTENYHERINRIAVKTGTKIEIIPVNEVEYLESQDDYVEIHWRDKKYLKLQRMKYYENALDANQFVRIHRRYIVNVSEIAKIEPLGKETHAAVLKSGEALTVSASGYGRLKEVLSL